MLLTLGFTQPDYECGYRPLADGYRIGAEQHSYTLHVPSIDSPGPAVEWARAAFLACNYSQRPTDKAAAAVWDALEAQVTQPLRSLSVGDTVAVRGQILACEKTGWRRIDANQSDAAAGTPTAKPDALE